MDKIQKLLDAANSRLKQSNAGIKIFQRGQKLSLRGMLPNKKGNGKSQQIISLGIYCNAAGIQSAEKQAQKLASQLTLKEFSWDDWISQTNNIGSVGYWIKEFETDYFNRKEKNDRTLTTWNTDYKAMFSRLNSTDNLSEQVLMELILTTEPDTRQRKRAVLAANSLAAFAKLNCDFTRYKGNYSHLSNGDRSLPSDEQIIQYYRSIPNPHWQRAFALIKKMTQSTNNELKYITDLLVELKSDIKETNKKIDNLTVDVATVKTDIAVVKANQDNFKKSIDKIPDLIENMATVKSSQDYTKEMLSKIDGTQKAQIWSLITLVLATIGTLTVALFKMK